MKIGIVSDTHKSQNHINKAIPYLKECDLIIHAGDNFSDSKYIYENANTDIIAVKGNCDYEDVEDEIVFEIEDKTVFLCHGHKYNVNFGINDLESKAKDVDADIAIFGHTHVPLIKEKDNILYLNPGSLTSPRGLSSNQFIIMDILNKNIDLKEILI